uniref:Uncharacterized protein n=1 Tax=Oryza rufipogon TaxID=4529 RepID=A0A0E0NXQ0_ORYRU
MAATCTAAWTRAPRQEQAAEIPIVLFPSVVSGGAVLFKVSGRFPEILQLAKDDEIKLGGRWKSLDTVLLVRYKRSTGEYPSTMVETQNS